MSVQNAKKPDQTLVFPVCKTLVVNRDVQTLLDMQAVGIRDMIVDLGPSGDMTTLVIKVTVNGVPMTYYSGNVLVKTEAGLEKYPDMAAFLAVYQIV